MIKGLDMDQGNRLQPESPESSGALMRAVDKASAGAHESVEQAANSVLPAVDRLAASAHRSVDTLAAAASHAAESIDVKGGQVREAQVRLTTQFRGYVQENPLTSLGLAMAAGFVLSRLVSPRQHP